MDYFCFSASGRKRGSSPGPLDNSPALKVQCLRVTNALLVLDNRFVVFFFFFFEREVNILIDYKNNFKRNKSRTFPKPIALIGFQ